MNPLRLTVRFRIDDAPADLSPAIETFHRFIQRGLVEGLLLDVADYRHVPDGPGVMLIGHDVDYGVNDVAFTVVRKRSTDDATTQLRDALRMGLSAIDALGDDPSLDVTVDRARFSVSVQDRRVPRDEAFAGLRAAVDAVVSEAFGPDVSIAPAEVDDEREAPELVVEVKPEAAASALDGLGGAQVPGQSPWDVPVEELARLRDSDEAFVLLDVREESEYEQVNLGGTLIPLGQLGDRLGELDPGARILVHCRVGRRGAEAVALLRDNGFEDAWNVNGALVAWRERIDASLPRY